MCIDRTSQESCGQVIHGGFVDNKHAPHRVVFRRDDSVLKTIAFVRDGHKSGRDTAHTTFFFLLFLIPDVCARPPSFLLLFHLSLGAARDVQQGQHRWLAKVRSQVVLICVLEEHRQNLLNTL